jgi:hypothetical protein
MKADKDYAFGWHDPEGVLAENGLKVLGAIIKEDK